MKVGEAMRSGMRIKRIPIQSDNVSNTTDNVSDSATVSDSVAVVGETGSEATQCNVNVTTGRASEPSKKSGKAGCGFKRGGQRCLTGVDNLRISAKSPIKHKKNKLGLQTDIAKDIYALESEYSNRKKFPIPLSRIIMMAGELGGYKYGRFGLLSYLTHIMEKDYKTYCNLLAKCVNSMDRVSLSELGLTDGNKRVRLEIVGLSESNDSDKSTTVNKTINLTEKNAINLKESDTINLTDSQEKIIEADFIAVKEHRIDDADSQNKDSR